MKIFNDDDDDENKRQRELNFYFAATDLDGSSTAS